MRRTYDYVLEGREVELSSTPQTASKLVDRSRISVGRRPNPRRHVHWTGLTFAHIQTSTSFKITLPD
jgi:hypothetical protein